MFDGGASFSWFIITVSDQSPHTVTHAVTARRCGCLLPRRPIKAGLCVAITGGECTAGLSHGRFFFLSSASLPFHHCLHTPAYLSHTRLSSLSAVLTHICFKDRSVILLGRRSQGTTVTVALALSAIMLEQ